MAIATQPLYISLQAFLGEPDYTHETILNFIAAATLTGSVVYKTTVAVPNSTTDQQVDMSALFPNLTACKMLVVIEVSSTPLAISVGLSAGTRVALTAGYPMIFFPNAGTPPDVYLTNASGSAAEVMVIAVA